MCDRIVWIDAARGIGIVLVVAGHVERGLVAANMAQGPAWVWIDYALYTFHMPLFFLLAGLNAPRSVAKGQRRFLATKFWTIAYPYVLWSLIQGGILIAFSSMTNGQISMSDLLAIGWQPIGQFWFLYALMGCQLAALLFAARPRWSVIAAAVALASSTALSPDGIAEKFLHAFPFFAVGMLVSERWPAWLQGGDRLRGAVAAIGLAVAVPLSGALDDLNFDALLALPATICGIVLVISISRLLFGKFLNFAVRLGQMTMSIYVMHILAAAGARIGLIRLHVALNPWMYLVICTTVGVAVPVAAHIWLSRQRLLAPLGLQPWRRSEGGLEASRSA